ncbi:hypothetical protein M433DRAFT_353824 [Acidomyces richmondensis BFW]|nr:MAG: hypothetical protein FE78DRAFT_525436 [Acidomyces sp. 'richmondensis']KYG49134.1 hypothetical protein M433DRAFT_353824 [Acidomyces richmondensis BFW]
MGGRYKRKLAEFDPTKSDSDDLDFDVSQDESRARPQKRSKSSKGGSRKSVKRRRERYGDSEDDIDVDSAGSSEEEESFAESTEPEEVERNPKTGRRVRSAAKRPVTYEEPSEEDIEVEEDSDIQPKPAARGARKASSATPAQESLIIKLKMPAKVMEDRRALRSRTGSKSVAKREPTPLSAAGTRRSSRISHDEAAPLVALTDSGKHETITRPGTQTPEPQRPPSRRATKGGKGLKKPPVSAIMEESQEGSGPTTQADERLSHPNQAAAGQQEQHHGLHTSPGTEASAGVYEDAMQTEEAEVEQIVQESMDENDEDDGPVSRGGRSLRPRRKASTPPTSQPPPRGGTRRSLRTKRSGAEPSSDFEPEAEGDADAEDDMSESDGLTKPSRGRSSNDDSQGGRRSGRLKRKGTSLRSRSRRNKSEDEVDDELDPDEIADEAADLEEDNRRNKRPRRRPASRSEIAFEPNLRHRGPRPDYRILRPELLLPLDDDDDAAAPAAAVGAAAATPQRNRRGGGGGAYRSLFSTYGPFGGAGGPPPVFGGPAGPGATGGVDSDSSDDEAGGRGGQQGIGGAVGMTPTSAFPKPYVPPPLNSDPLQGPGGGPPGLGKVKDKKALADADPLGIDPNVSFEGVGGLDEHIDRLKEMVALPLLYPEIFQRFKVTPPRGVLFHGPPGTGKTLLARALASSVSSHGKKVTFYMRKGADALSKWVGEAEKQLRLLFEEARKNQPSIIFFDEIDGLAPVRSSKQEQIHASIVATLLALMDGMDGRGQVIVIGATNRPDSVDPALRRPGRFDREFYFPLPDVKARRAIIDIHTKGWDPPLQPAFKDQLAEITKGYGGADLRALCTEAALNAVQGTYPQIYSSDQKLVIDPNNIKVLAKDFMISINKIVPSSERSAMSGAAPLKRDIEPLLRKYLHEVSSRIDEAIPRKRKVTALEEAMYDNRDEDDGFERETMQRHFESSRIFRPRLLIWGLPGMGQQYLGSALLSKFEGLHVQSFDMATLLKDSTRSPEAAIVQLFEEVKRHKPSVIYLPDVDLWYDTLSDSAVRTFTGLLRSLPPTDPILLLGIMGREPNRDDETDKKMLSDLFGYSQKNQYPLKRPDKQARKEYFAQIIDYIRKKPTDFPDAGARKRRKLDVLPVAEVPEVPRGPTKAELKAQKKKDRQTLNMLKLHIQSVMDQIKLKYRKFRTPIIDDAAISYLYDEQNPELVTTDLTEEQRQQQQLFRPYELDKDEKGVAGLREVASGKFYYNLEIVTIEKRLSNGYYKRPKDFLGDIKRLAKDARTSGDQDRTLKANEMLANVEVDMATLEQQQPLLVAECEAVYEREQERERERQMKFREAQRQGEPVPKVFPNVPPLNASKTTTESTGPVVLGQEVPGKPSLFPVTPSRYPTGSMFNPWSTTNGGSHPSNYTNGDTGPSRPPIPPEDSEMMLDSQADERGWQGSPSHTQGQRSQKSVHTQIAHGSQVEQYHNSASTTTSGQKTSDKSTGTTRSSGPLSSVQSNGVVRPATTSNYPIIEPVVGGSLPDTQPEAHSSSWQSQTSQPSSQQMPPPPPAASAPTRQSSIHSMLNNPSEDGPEEATTTTPHFFLEEPSLRLLHDSLTDRSSGMSVEQLEQVYAALMNVIWDSRGDWNRNHVVKEVQDAFNETVRDVEVMQEILRPSQ